MDRHHAINGLPALYALAIRLHDEGADPHTIAVAVGVGDDAVTNLLSIGAAKLARLEAQVAGGTEQDAATTGRQSGPTELDQAIVRDSEMVGHLVDDGRGDHIDELGLTTGQAADRSPKDGDPVGHDPGVRKGGTTGEIDSLVQAQEGAPAAGQLRRGGPILDQDDDVFHQPPQGLGNLVEGVSDELLERLGAGVDHRPSLPPC